MGQKMNKWDMFKNLPNAMEPNPDLADRVKQELDSDMGTVKRPHARLWKIALPCVAACAAFCVGFMFVYPSLNPSTTVQRYFSEENIDYFDIENINEFISSKQSNIHYYEGEMVTSRYGEIKETQETVLFLQNVIYIAEGYFDKIELTVPLKSNDQFEILDPYQGLNENTVISDITIKYKIENADDGKSIKAKFIYDNVGYYLTITTPQETGKIEQYVTLLLSD